MHLVIAMLESQTVNILSIVLVSGRNPSWSPSNLLSVWLESFYNYRIANYSYFKKVIVP